jgi:hypothetical protein
MTAMYTDSSNPVNEYLDAACQRIETWKAAHPNHTQDELETISNTFYEVAYAEFNAVANTLSKGPRMDYLHITDSHV